MKAEAAAQTIMEECLALRVRRLSRIVTRLFDGALRPFGLTVCQLTLLVVLEQSGPSAPLAVAKRLDLDKSTLSRNLGRLIDNGWVRETPDGPGKRLEVTSAGRELLGKAYGSWAKAQGESETRLGRGLVDALQRLEA
jgi:DNA-binding MarR family transcriptional regulator